MAPRATMTRAEINALRLTTYRVGAAERRALVKAAKAQGMHVSTLMGQILTGWIRGEKVPGGGVLPRKAA